MDCPRKKKKNNNNNTRASGSWNEPNCSNCGLKPSGLLALRRRTSQTAFLLNPDELELCWSLHKLWVLLRQCHVNVNLIATACMHCYRTFDCNKSRSSTRSLSSFLHTTSVKNLWLISSDARLSACWRAEIASIRLPERDVTRWRDQSLIFLFKLCLSHCTLL